MTAELLVPGPDWPSVLFEERRDPGPDEEPYPEARLAQEARDPELVGLDALEGLARAEAVAYAEQVRRLAGLAGLGRRDPRRPDPERFLWALLPAEQARAFTLGLDELQRRQRVSDPAEGVDRTVDQRRADLFALLPALALHALDGTAPAPGPGGSTGYPSLLVNVHVPVATALALSHEPGAMEGHGPISAEHVRRLLPSAALRLVLVDEGTGEPRHVDPTVHPPADDGTQGRPPRIRSPARLGPSCVQERVTRPSASPGSSGCATRCARGRAARWPRLAATSTTCSPGRSARPARTTSARRAAGATGPRRSAGRSPGTPTAATPGTARPAGPTGSHPPGHHRPRCAVGASPPCRSTRGGSAGCSCRAAT